MILFPTKPVSIAVIALMVLSFPAYAQEELIPPNRLMTIADTDLPGGDLAQIFDVTLGACVQTCLNNSDCRALTYNQKSRACFPKGAQSGAPAPFVGALSGWVIDTDPAMKQRAADRAAAAPWINETDLAGALAQASRLSSQYLPVDGEDSLLALRQAESDGNNQARIRLQALLTARGDEPGQWIDLARYLLQGGQNDETASAAINGYLRAPDDATAGMALRWISEAWQQQDRNIDALEVMRLAGRLSADESVADALQRAESELSLRVTETEVEADSSRPRICVDMSYELDEATDYAPYIRMNDQAMTVDASGKRLCIGGVARGQTVEITLRAGLPAANGQTLREDVPVNGYIRDRDPQLRFASRAYVLPAGGDQALSITTVNAGTIDLRLLKVSDRNLIRVVQEDLFAKSLDEWRSNYLKEAMADEVWRGQADIPGFTAEAMNQELTTRLAIPEAAGPLAPGIYALQASLPDKPEDETGVEMQWFVISDLGITSMSGAEGMTVVVRALSDTGPKPGAEVTLLSRANAVLARAATDAEGFAQFAAGDLRGEGSAAPGMLVVTEWQGEGADRQPADLSFLPLTDPEFDLSDRGVEGLPPAPPIDVFLTTDRGAYRAGEVVNTTFVARDAAAHAISGLPLTAILYRPDGVEFSRQMPAEAGAGGYAAAIQIPGGAPRGSWRLDIKADPKGAVLASTRVLVEDFLPERIDFSIDLPEGPIGAGTAVRAALDARWLFGAPAANLPVEGQLRLAPATTLPGFDGYRFGRYDDETSPRNETLPAGQTDAQGLYAATLPLPDEAELGGRATSAETIFNIREGAGRPVERTETRMILPSRPMIGIKPQFEDDTVSEGSEAPFQVIAAGPDLTPVAIPVRWVLNRLESDYQWYRINGDWQVDRSIRRTLVSDGTAELGSDPLSVSARVEWGEYELVVQPEGVAAEPASVSFWAGWGARATAGTDTPDRLDVTLDQPGYRVGDTAQVRVEAQASGRAILSVLSNRVISAQMVDLEEGENLYSVPVTEEWGAGAYVTVSALRGVEETPGSRIPVRALGLSYVPVDPGARALKATLETPAEASPRGTIPVTLRVEGVAPGETAYATIAAVDQGILNLTGFTSPDPSKHYFGQRRLGVGLRDLYGRLIMPGSGADGVIRQGGDAMATAQMMAPPPTEKLMAWFSGALTVGPDGTATVDLPVPDFNGEIRVMAVVWSKTGIGQAESAILTRDPVVATITAPRFLAPGDSARVTINLTHVTGPAGEVALRVEQTDGDTGLNPGELPASVALTELGSQRLSLPVRADLATGTGKLRLVLTTPGGQDLTKDITIPVMQGEPEVMRQSRLTLAGGQAMTLSPDLTAGLLPGARVTLTAGPMAMLDVAGALGQLSRYPYGCTEQVTSAAMPLLYLSELSQLTGRDDTGPNPSEAVDKAITQVLARQSSSGSFGLWRPESGDTWLDAYATDFLSRARAAGHEVPQAAFDSAIANLQNRINYAGDPQYADSGEIAAQAYALAVLARERAASISDLRYYADTAIDKFETPMAAAHLGAALAFTGDQARADRMFTRARNLMGADVTETGWSWRSDYGSTLRDRAATLAIAASAHSEVIDQGHATRDVAALIAARTQNGWGLSTQELLWTVLAAHELAGDTPSIAVNGQPLATPVAALSEGATLVNSGSTPVELTFAAFGTPREPAQAGGKGFSISRSYYTTEGEPVDPAQVALGTRLVAVLDVTPHSDGGGRLIVNDPLPAGFEIDNPNLIRAGDISALDWIEPLESVEMAEFRQDRFTAAVNWTGSGSFRLSYILRAVTPGEFRHPSASVEDMYRPEYRAWTDGGQVSVGVGG